MAIDTEINLPDGAGGFNSYHPKTNINQVEGLGLERNKACVAGDIAFTINLPSSLYLECTTGGTTGATEPTFSGASVGDTVTDGTAAWVIRKFGSVNAGSGSGGNGVTPVDENSTISFALGCDDNGMYIVFNEEDEQE